MPRVSTVDVPVDTALFTPIGLQVRPMLSLGMSGWASWLLDHWKPFPRLLQDERFGVVVAAFDVTFPEPCSFFDTDAFQFEAGVSLREDGRLLFVDGFLTTYSGTPVMTGCATLRPVHIGEALSLSARAGDATDSVRQAFKEDEIVSRTEPERARALPDPLRRVENAPVLGQASRDFTITRSLCEVADQWSAIAVPDLAAAVREQMASEDECLASCLTERLVELHVEFRRAAFFLDSVVVESTAHAAGKHVTFVHRYKKSQTNEELAVVVEAFGEPIS